MKEYGSQTGDAPKTVTMRQALASGRALPKVSMVAKVFKPGKYGGIGLVTEAGYKCSIGEASPLFSEMLRMFDTLQDEGTCLAVRIDNEAKCMWTLVELEENECSWEEHSWGFTVEDVKAQKAAPKQTTEPAKGRKRAGADPVDGGTDEWENPPSLR